MLRKYLKVILVFTAFVVVGCITPSEDSSSSITTSETPTSFDYKINDGVGAIFDEEMGFYNSSASVIAVDENNILVYYTTNEVKNVQGDVIAYRKGTLKNGIYEFSPKQIVLRPSENNWDSKRVNSPDVIKGEFSLNSTVYNYLMAYAGNKVEAEKQYQVGLAVAVNPEGPWIKVGNEAFIKYDPVIYGSTFGVASPSLVSHNEKGQVRLFTTFADDDLTSTRVYDLDLSNLDSPIGKSAYRTISVLGLLDKDLGVHPMLNNADFALDYSTDTLYVVRDLNPLASINPTVADSLQVAKADVRILNEIEPIWEIVKNIDDRDTVDENNEESLGWSRIYSGTIVSDLYGRVTGDKIVVVYTSSRIMSSPTDKTYLFTPALHQIVVEMGE